MQMTPFQSRNAIGLHGSGVVRSQAKPLLDSHKQGVRFSDIKGGNPLGDFIQSISNSIDALERGQVRPQTGREKIKEMLEEMDPALSMDVGNHAALPGDYQKKGEKPERPKAKNIF